MGCLTDETTRFRGSSGGGSNGCVSLGNTVAEDAPAYSSIASKSRDHPGGNMSARFATGQGLRLASALLQGLNRSTTDRAAACDSLKATVTRATNRPSIRNDKEALSHRLKQLTRDTDRNVAEQLDLLVIFDQQQLFLQDGCRSMIVWMDRYLRLGRIAASERLRVGRALQQLPVLHALFALGEVSFSQLREVTRHACAENDGEFAAAILELSVAETIDYCNRFRHLGDTDDDARTAAEQGLDAAEAAAALRAFHRRSLTVQHVDDHSTRIVIELPNDLAAEFVTSLEQVEDWIKEGGECYANESHKPVTEGGASADATPSPKQRRADSAVLMSRRSLALAGEAVSAADRYRVHVTVDARSLSDAAITDAIDCERPQLVGYGPLCKATARRLVEQSGFTLLATDNDGQVIGTRAKAPPFTRRQLRALQARDRCCQVPGCRSTRHLHGHHLVHRENGGHSGLDNAVLVCGSCHRLLHEGGFRLEAIGPNGAVPEKRSADLLDKLKVNRSSRERARTKSARVRKFRLKDSEGYELKAGAKLGRVLETMAGGAECRRTVLFPRGNKTAGITAEQAMARAG